MYSSTVQYSTVQYSTVQYSTVQYSTGNSLLRSNSTLAFLSNQRLVDVGDDSTASNGGLDQGVQLLVSPDGELEMSGGDPLHLEILTGVTGQLEDLSSEVL